MIIREATISDAEVLAELTCDVQRLHAEAHPDIFKPAEVTPELIQFFRVECEDDTNTFYLLEVDQQAVGYIFAKHIIRLETPFSYAREALSIQHISVKPDFHGKGYGEALINQAIDLARSKGINKVNLATWDFNEHAQGFFKKQGFSVLNYYMSMDLD